ncbi:ATP-binding SpoIIE family protein phosphatase [Actinacidiphila bryophytorum]|uniref:ATP-binding SpoIIE family protein phosphatase n=1 Tax=Actinacidiphila bryophytorum TaxID=1436133 RepID=UPI002176AFB6|nr:SpoIIE family protein phosphatase [Actinacidiphila bryophytorum]UWE07378.1 SpoIIE family protein phosphatase [Actinacidiphila bryophytorum]
MHSEDVLAAVGYGLWQWDEGTGNITVDGCAAHLLGLPGGAATHRSSAVRACLHAADYVSLSAAVSLAAAEGTVAESVVRVVGDDGTVLRTLRARAAPKGQLVNGTLHEVHGAPRATTAAAVAGDGDWRRAREAFLLDAGRALAEADSTAEVLRVAATLSMPGFSPDGLAVFGVEGGRLSVIGHHGQDPADAALFDMTLSTDYPAAQVARTGRAIYLASPEEYAERFPATWPLVEPYGRTSWAYLPLVVAGTTIGAWMAAFREPVAFTPDERAVLTTVARMLGQALSRAGLHESERALTDGLQQTMMPARKPGVSGMAVAARYVPTGGGLQVGGDWYDVIALPSGRTAIVIGDVQGHDVRAAGLMGQLRIALRAYAAEGHGPDAVLSRTSRFLAGLADEHGSDMRFATCLYVEIDPLTGTLDVVRAGHPEPAIRLGDGTTIVRRTAVGLPLGIEPDADYPTTRMVLEPGEVLLLCTDGLIETGGHDLESGWQRLSRALAAGPANDLEVLADSLIHTVHGPASHHEPGPLSDRREDDVALVLLRRDPDGPTCAVPVRRTILTVSQADPGQIRSCRDDIRALLHDWAPPEQVESAVLLVSEVVTNVLVHTDGDAVLLAQITGMPGTRRLHVDVGDSSDDMPHRRSPGEMASSGRGLLLLEELADAWGVDPRGDGKSTWFELYETPALPVG